MILYFIVFETFFLVFIIYLIFYLVFYKLMLDFESVSSYECGFDSMSLTRVTFSYRFFLISILFIIFDVEISLMLCIPFLVGMIFGIWLFYIFVLILLVGLLYEYYYGSLEWLDILF